MTKAEIYAKRKELQKAIYDAEDRVHDLEMQIASAKRELLRLNYEEKLLHDQERIMKD